MAASTGAPADRRRHGHGHGNQTMHVTSLSDPAEIRAIAFAASLGPQRPPHSTGREDIVIDLAGEEALVEFLMRITPVDAND